MARQIVQKGKFLDVLEKALQAGITCFQFREKGEQGLKGSDKLLLARETSSTPVSSLSGSINH